ncbi:MAG: hypothetical protein RQ885_00730 [Desulfurococcales archaeon]|jgi:hypothetical protein|nr:hypothetical protein [Desulfurococcales archaeon]
MSRKRAKKSRKRNARTLWRRIHRRMSEVALTVMWIRGTHLEKPQMLICCEDPRGADLRMHEMWIKNE